MFRRVARAEASGPDHPQQLATSGSTGKLAFASQRSLRIPHNYGADALCHSSCRLRMTTEVQAPTIGACFAARPPCYARGSEISYRLKITEDRKTCPENLPCC